MKKHWKNRPHRRHRAPLFPLILILVGCWFFFSRPHTSNAQDNLPLPIAINPQAAPNPHVIEGQTYWSEDVTVSEGQTIDNDLVMLSGDVTIESGGKVAASVINLSGDVNVEEGGSIGGDVTVWSGNVAVDGAVNGSIAAWSGDIDLGESAVVNGDVSAMSGDIETRDGTQIHGNVVRGPGFKWPNMVNPFSEMAVSATNGANGSENASSSSVEVERKVSAPGVVERFFGFILRVIGAVFFSVVAALLAALVFNVRPELVSRIRTNLHEQPVYAAVAGAVLNVPMLLVSGLLFITFCLAPLALPPLLLLLVLNLVGLTGIAQIAGERLTKALNMKLEPLFVVGLGAFAVVGSLSLLWAFGGCFRGIAWIVGFVGGSMGVGALIMPWLKNFSNGTSANRNSTPATLAPVDVTIGDHGTKSTSATAASEQASVQPAAPVDVQIIEPKVVDAPVEIAASVVETPVSEEPTSAAPVVEPDDFTIIKGIGPVLDRRLKAAGIQTFAQLAELTPERMAEICERPLSWILEDDLLGQAQHFAEKK